MSQSGTTGTTENMVVEPPAIFIREIMDCWDDDGFIQLSIFDSISQEYRTIRMSERTCDELHLHHQVVKASRRLFKHIQNN